MNTSCRTCSVDFHQDDKKVRVKEDGDVVYFHHAQCFSRFNGCARCGKAIEGSFHVALDKKFHPTCFTCVTCNEEITSSIKGK
eukprot:Awhi_evm1s15008